MQIWLQRLKDSTSHKRLNLIYLANGKSVQTVSFICPVCLPCGHEFGTDIDDSQRFASNPKCVTRKTFLLPLRPSLLKPPLRLIRAPPQKSSNGSKEWLLCGGTVVCLKSLSRQR